MHAIDFASIKERFPVELVMERMLALPVTKVTRQNPDDADQWRCPCPSCQSSDTRSLVITAGKGAYCRSLRKGGDVIFLVSHIKNLPFRKAAEEIETFFSATPEPKTAKADLANVATYLQHGHPDVQALGISPETAKTLGIGYKPKGWAKGAVVLPLFEDGKLAGYTALMNGTLKFPSTLTAS